MSSENCLVYGNDVFFKMCLEGVFLKQYIRGIAPWRSWDMFCAIWNYRRKIFWVRKKSIDSHRKTRTATSSLSGKCLLFQATRKISWNTTKGLTARGKQRYGQLMLCSRTALTVPLPAAAALHVLWEKAGWPQRPNSKWNGPCWADMVCI